MQQPDSLPLRQGDDASFRLVREALMAAGFDEAALCARLRIHSLPELEGVQRSAVDFGPWPAPLAVLTRLFLLREALGRREAEDALGREVVEALAALGLLRAADGDVAATVLLYPVHGFLVASDLPGAADDADIVFPAIYAGTLAFLRLLPEAPAGCALDIGAGTGIGAFVLSRRCERAVASDVTRRAAAFAEFNARLGALDRVEVACGDAYEPVRGRAFDRIVAHPPYVPSLRDDVTWRDGGDLGESLVRKIIEGLPAHLAPGGLALVVAMGIDMADAPFENRVRRWLGSASDEMDVLFAGEQRRTPADVLDSLARKSVRRGSEELPEIGRRLLGAGVVAMTHGALLVRRHASPSSPWTQRTALTDETRGADLEWILRWHDLRARPGFRREVLDIRAVTAPWVRVLASHAIEGGGLVARGLSLETERPARRRDPVDPALLPFLLQCDGGSTLGELHRRERAAGRVPPEVDEETFAALVTVLLERGHLVPSGDPRLGPDPAQGAVPTCESN